MTSPADDLGAVADPARPTGAVGPEAQPGEALAARSARDRVLEEALRDDPTSFEFFQAVRLIESLRTDRAAVGGFAEPDDEAVAFTVNPSLSFPPSEIQSLELPEDGQARMSVNFLGLVGPLGVLPHVYTLLVAETRRTGQDALGDFLDIFQHRVVSLFYRAWKKHRFTVAHEEGAPDPLTTHLLDLVGIGQEQLRGLLPVRDEALAYHAGLLAPVQRSAVALEALISDYFGVEARVVQFVGEWHGLSRRDLCVVGEEIPSSRLGLGAVVGDEIWDPHAEVRIRLGPMDRAMFESFLPGGRAHTELVALTDFFAHGEFDFDVQLVLRDEEVPACRLGEGAGGTRLGWSTWMPRGPHQGDADDAIIAL